MISSHSDGEPVANIRFIPKFQSGHPKRGALQWHRNRLHWMQGHREFPFGNFRESATSKIPGGNSRELLSFRREFLGVYKISNFSYFLLWIVKARWQLNGHFALKLSWAPSPRARHSNELACSAFRQNCWEICRATEYGYRHTVSGKNVTQGSGPVGARSVGKPLRPIGGFPIGFPTPLLFRLKFAVFSLEYIHNVGVCREKKG